MQKKKVAFLGLGVMGFPMAGHLAQAGYGIVVYNRNACEGDAVGREIRGEWRDQCPDSGGGRRCRGHRSDVRRQRR